MSTVNESKKKFPTLVVIVGIVVAIILLTILNNLNKTEAAPAPASTVTVTAEAVAPVVDDSKLELCQEVATELWNMVGGMNQDVALPYSEVVQILIDQIQKPVYDSSEIDRATGKLRGASSVVQGYTADIDGHLGADYSACTE